MGRRFGDARFLQKSDDVFCKEIIRREESKNGKKKPTGEKRKRRE